jgi:hypothetical protein
MENITFEDVIRESLRCGEIHAEAKFSLLKEEASNRIIGSEAPGAWWANIKSSVRKMYESLKNLTVKLASYLKTFPIKYEKIRKEAYMVTLRYGQEKKLIDLEKNTSRYRLVEDNEHTVVNIDYYTKVIKAIANYLRSNVDFEDINVNGIEENKANATIDGMEDILDRIGRESAVTVTIMKTNKPEAIREVFDFIKFGGKARKAFEADAEEIMDVISAMGQLSDKIASLYDEAYKNQDEAKIVAITSALSFIRRVCSIFSVLAAKLLNFASEAVLSYTQYIDAALSDWALIGPSSEN